MKNIKIVGLIVALAMVVDLQALAEASPAPYPTYTPKEFNITTAMLTQAGFTGVQAITKASTSSYFPVDYFKVNETLSADQKVIWGSSANIVSVFVRKMPTDWVYNNGEMKIVNLDGRVSISASKGEYYFVAIGPDQPKIAKLLELLETKY
jgi:hypothetical protein